MDDHDEEKRREQNLIVRCGKSEAEVTKDRRLRSTYCTVEANYWQTRSIASSRGLSAIAELLVLAVFKPNVVMIFVNNFKEVLIIVFKDNITNVVVAGSAVHHYDPPAACSHSAWSRRTTQFRICAQQTRRNLSGLNLVQHCVINLQYIINVMARHVAVSVTAHVSVAVWRTC